MTGCVKFIPFWNLFWHERTPIWMVIFIVDYNLEFGAIARNFRRSNCRLAAISNCVIKCTEAYLPASFQIVCRLGNAYAA